MGVSDIAYEFKLLFFNGFAAPPYAYCVGRPLMADLKNVGHECPTCTGVPQARTRFPMQNSPRACRLRRHTPYTQNPP